MLNSTKKIMGIFCSVLLIISCGGGGGGGDGAGAGAGETLTPVSKYSKVGNFPITDCVKDNITGLTWEGKTNSGLRDYRNQYTNFDNINAKQNSYTFHQPPYPRIFVPLTQNQIDAPTNSIGYKNYVNSIALCGYTDWRMPTFEELNGLVYVNSQNSINIDGTWFPNTFSTPHWTSSGLEALYPNQDNSYLAMFVIFYPSTNPVKWHDRTVPNFVRLVR